MNETNSLAVAAPETVSITKAEETQALMQKVVDSKITRSELLDIIVEKVAREMGKELDAIDKERQAIVPEIARSTALRLMKSNAKTKVCVESTREYDHDLHQYKDGRTYHLTAKVALKVDELPVKYRAQLEARKVLDEKFSALLIQKQRLDHGKQRARLDMLKHSLESTPEGQRILEAIDGMKDNIRAKLTEEQK